jgi:putative colanic acid biosynthesis acetyltransferase WcaF
VALLRLFGSKIGSRAIIKPGVNVKSPWFLELGDDVWIGERCWIDSLAPVRLGNNVCLSQDVYLCCGNHDWTSPTFAKHVQPIVIEDGVWVAARGMIMGGVTLASHSVVGAYSLVTKSTESYEVYSGNPAQRVRTRNIRPEGE